jgi:hypothetical protein
MRWRHALSWFALLVVGLVATWLRYGFIEPRTVAQLCDAGHVPLWCSARQWLVLGFLYDVYGVAAVLAAVAALLGERPWLAWLAAALGAFALQLYCYETGALALLVGCLRLLRLQVSTGRSPGEQYRQRDRQIQSQP